MTGSELFAAIVASAESHGLDSEPDHEVGDLQDALRIILAEGFVPADSIGPLLERLQKDDNFTELDP